MADFGRWPRELDLGYGNVDTRLSKGEVAVCTEPLGSMSLTRTGPPFSMVVPWMAVWAGM